MKLAQRLFYYLGGFAIGLILLFFFLGGKKASCDYGPSARVLKNIRIKKKTFSEQASDNMLKYQIDTVDIALLLTNGDVSFSKSNTKLDSCKIYFIEGSVKEKNISMLIENCDSIARVNVLDIIQ
ncbi:hypothetical protein ATE84_3195 [Aquimarina sp. MAR_2010_214]|uniref:DUF4258 domain-containing protein n=1 Tax=Aquimarina sp. MAR_2010_214 TaxID=1250026 RepID=UPI000C705EDF|nr:DUF4258 domain-containing protein [Aquimarina sp. MAR_2010_214]PKV51125.1 hypothetical protein ATE84_3195 [Aquimarina sp. MAR_2010_214]